ncbi:hypothetical protein D3C83_260140 [compost metagenome]
MEIDRIPLDEDQARHDLADEPRADAGRRPETEGNRYDDGNKYMPMGSGEGGNPIS